jgi:biotin transporter BioY
VEQGELYIATGGFLIGFGTALFVVEFFRQRRRVRAIEIAFELIRRENERPGP